MHKPTTLIENIKRQENLEINQDALTIQAWCTTYGINAQAHEKIGKFLTAAAAVGITVTSGLAATKHINLTWSALPFSLFGFGYLFSMGVLESLADQHRKHANVLLESFNHKLSRRPELPAIKKGGRYFVYGIASLLLTINGAFSVGWSIYHTDHKDTQNNSKCQDNFSAPSTANTITPCTITKTKPADLSIGRA